MPTIGIDFKIKRIEIDGKKVKVQVNFYHAHYHYIFVIINLLIIYFNYFNYFNYLSIFYNTFHRFGILPDKKDLEI